MPTTVRGDERSRRKLKRFSLRGVVPAGVVALLAAAFPSPALELGEELSPTTARAEAALRAGEVQLAESLLREALYEGWLLLGELELTRGALPAARAAFEEAGRVAVETRRALLSLALVELRLGELDAAAERLREHLSRFPKDTEAQRLLAQALLASGADTEAVQVLEEARAVAPDDLELAFALGTAHLHLRQGETAAELFAEIAEARPSPRTRVLLGRTYRDFRDYDRARAELRAALDLEPRARRARYYLGTIELLSEGRWRLDEAVEHFRAELEQDPRDPQVNLYLGLALAEGRRFEEALGPLEIASQAPNPRADAFHFMGRSYLQTGKIEAALDALGRALEIAGGVADADQLSSIHYQTALAFRRSGDEARAAEHFAAAERHSNELTVSLRQSLGRYLEGELERDAGALLMLTRPGGSGVAELGAAERGELYRRVTETLGRAHLNLGVLQARAGHFDRAADLFARGLEAAPGFAELERSLGVAAFNAGRFEEAAATLEKTLEAAPDDAQIRRLLGLAHLNLEAWDRAAELLAGDPGRGDDPSLQYAYGLALVRSGRAAEAEPVFDRLFAEHEDWPELHTLVGQAHAQDGNFPEAIRSFERALELDPEVAEAQAGLGVIYLRQGEFEKAETALRAELEIRPEDLRSRFHLATVLELEGELESATQELERVLDARPAFADARQLLGKILLGRGEVARAVEHLEAAVELDPENPTAHYQLGQAYQKAGRPELARERFERFRELKNKVRGGGT